MALFIGILAVAFIISINDFNHRRTQLIIGKHKVFNGRVMMSALFLFVLLFILTAFRDKSVGNDTRTYIKIFNNIVNNGVGGFSTRIEIGYKYYCFILGKISTNPQILLIITALICYGITGWFIFSNCYYQGAMVALFMTIYFKSFCSGMRQEMAFCICIVAYTCLKKGRNYLGGVLIVLAATFHITALVALFYFIIPFISKKKEYIIPFLLFLISLFVFAKFSGIMEFFDRYGSYYERYYNEAGQAKIGFWSCLLTLIQSIYAVYSYVLIRRLTGKINHLWNDDMFWFGIMILFISLINFFVNNISRVLWYFELPFFVSLVNYSDEISNKERNKILIPLVTIYILSMIVGMIFRPYYYSLFPYSFWINA